MLFDAIGTGGSAVTAGGGAAGSAAKATGAAATVWAGSATGTAAAAGAGAARLTGGTAFAGRTTLAVRWVVVDLLALVVAAGSTLDSIGSLAMAAGSLTIGVAGALSTIGVVGATGTGGATSGAAWASKAVEETARTAAIAVIAGRIFAFLWVILRATNGEPLWVRPDRRRLLIGHAPATALSH
jgi:hypothetical protein